MEGNRGLGVGATGITEAVGPKSVIRAADGDFGFTPDEVLEYTEALEEDTRRVPQDAREACLDRALATCAIDMALRRHAGVYAKEEDAVMGVMAGAAMRRDLRNVKTAIASGEFLPTATRINVRKWWQDVSESLAARFCRCTCLLCCLTITMCFMQWACWANVGQTLHLPI